MVFILHCYVDVIAVACHAKFGKVKVAVVRVKRLSASNEKFIKRHGFLRDSIARNCELFGVDTSGVTIARDVPSELDVVFVGVVNRHSIFDGGVEHTSALSCARVEIWCCFFDYEGEGCHLLEVGAVALVNFHNILAFGCQIFQLVACCVIEVYKSVFAFRICWGWVKESGGGAVERGACATLRVLVNFSEDAIFVDIHISVIIRKVRSTAIFQRI